MSQSGEDEDEVGQQDGQVDEEEEGQRSPTRIILPTQPGTPTQTSPTKQSRTSQSSQPSQDTPLKSRTPAPRHLLTKWTERTFDLEMKHVNIDHSMQYGQVRQANLEHVEVIIASAKQCPMDKNKYHDCVVWHEGTTGTYYALSRQHWIIAMKQYVDEYRAATSRPPPKWMTHVRAVELKADCPMGVRLEISASENTIESTVRKPTDFDVLAAYYKFKQKGKSWQENLRKACELSSQLVKHRMTYLQRTAKKGQVKYDEVDWTGDKSLSDVVCSVRRA